MTASVTMVVAGVTSEGKLSHTRRSFRSFLAPIAVAVAATASAGRPCGRQTGRQAGSQADWLAGCVLA